MSRRKGTIERNSFIKGLITEASPLTFPENASIVDENFELNRDGSRSRRLGIDYEGSHTANEIITANEITDAQISTFEWFDAGTTENRNFIVAQVGSILHFFAIEDSDILSANKREWTVDLLDYSVNNSPEVLAAVPDAYTSFDVIRGLLVVTNERCNPIYVAYDGNTNTFAAGIITVRTRDFLGIDDGFAVDYRPPVSQYDSWYVGFTPTGYPSTITFNRDSAISPHWYNLHNQGWDARGIWHSLRGIAVAAAGLVEGHGLPINEWDGSASWFNIKQGWPSNADIMSLGKVSSSATTANIGRYFSYQLYKQRQGTTPAPRGSNILNTLDSIRALNFTNVPDVASAELASKTMIYTERSGIRTGTMSYVPATEIISFQADGTMLSDGTIAALAPKPNTPIRIKGVTAKIVYTVDGVPFTEDVPESLLSFLDADITPIVDPTFASGVITYQINWNFSANLIPGAVIASVLLSYDKAQVYYYADAEHEIVDRRTEDFGYTTTASYASRAWYTGLSTGQFQNYIFYSQTIKSHADLGKCYSEGDPASEFNNDVVDTDGGYLVIPEADRIIKLLPMGRNLFVFATNGVWRISGGEDNFTATSNSSDKISSVGVESPKSIVPVESSIFFWSSGGIYLVGMSETGEYEVKNISEETIQTDYLDISTLAKQNVKGAYDPTTKKIVWLVNESPDYVSSGGVENTNKYDTLYIFETVLGAFYKHKIATDTTNTLPFIADVIQLPSTTEVGTLQDVYSNTELVTSNTDQVVSTVDLPRDTLVQSKVFVVSRNTGGTPFVTFAEFNNLEFLDWFGHDGVGTNYTSRLVTGYELGESMSKKKQAMYVHMFFKRTETAFEGSDPSIMGDNESSCKIVQLWDFASLPTDAQFTSKSFQAYRIPRWYATSGNTYDYGQDVIVSKSKIRGKGRALSLDIRSEEGKDLYIYGWGIPITRQERI